MPLDQAQAEKKFRSLSTTQDSIQSVTLWVIHHKTQHEKVVDIWFKVLKKSKIDHRLTLFYACNDIVQTCRRKHAVVYKDAFKEVLKDATLLVRDGTVKASVKRIFTIWEQRGIYDKEFVEELVDIIDHTKVQPAISSKLLADFQPLTLMEKVITLNRYENELEHRRRQLVNLRMDASSLEAIRQLKDKKHGQDFCREFESACTKMEDYVKAVEKEISDKNELIELLEQSELYYDAQYGEAKIVANAYKTFGGKVNALKRQLTEKIHSLPDTVTPPYSPPDDVAAGGMSSPDVTPPQVEEITSPIPGVGASSFMDSPRPPMDDGRPAFMATNPPQPFGEPPPPPVPSSFYVPPVPNSAPLPPDQPTYAPPPSTPPTPQIPPRDALATYRASPKHTPVELPPYLQGVGAPPPPPMPAAKQSGKGGDKLEAIDMDLSDGEIEAAQNGMDQNHDSNSPKSDIAPQASPILDKHPEDSKGSLPSIAQGANSSFFGKEDMLAAMSSGKVTDNDEGGSTPVMDEDQEPEREYRKSSSSEYRRSDDRRRDDRSSRYDDRSSSRYDSDHRRSDRDRDRYDDHHRREERRHERGSREERSRDERRRDSSSRDDDRRDDDDRSRKTSSGSRDVPTTTKTNPIDFLTSLINAKPSSSATSSSSSSSFLASLGALVNTGKSETPVTTQSDNSEGSWANWKANEGAGSSFSQPPPPIFGAPPQPPMPPGLSPPTAIPANPPFPTSTAQGFTGSAPSYPTYNAPSGPPPPPQPPGLNGHMPPFGPPSSVVPASPSVSQPPPFPPPLAPGVVPPFRPPNSETMSASQPPPGAGVQPFRPTLSIPTSGYDPSQGQHTSPQGGNYPPHPRGPSGDYGASRGQFPSTTTPPTPPAFGAPQGYQPPRFPGPPPASGDQQFHPNRFAGPTQSGPRGPPLTPSRQYPGGPSTPGRGPPIRPHTPEHDGQPNSGPGQNKPPWSQFMPTHNKANLTTIQTVEYGQPNNDQSIYGHPPGGPRFGTPRGSEGLLSPPMSSVPRPRFVSENAPVPAVSRENSLPNHPGGEGQMEFIDKLRRKSGSVGSEAPNLPFERQHSSNLRTLTHVPMDISQNEAAHISEDKHNEQNTSFENDEHPMDEISDGGFGIGSFLSSIRKESENNQDRPIQSGGPEDNEQGYSGFQSPTRRDHWQPSNDFKARPPGPGHRPPPMGPGQRPRPPLTFRPRHEFRPRSDNFNVRPFRMRGGPPRYNRFPGERPPRPPVGPDRFGPTW